MDTPSADQDKPYSTRIEDAIIFTGHLFESTVAFQVENIPQPKWRISKFPSQRDFEDQFPHQTMNFKSNISFPNEKGIFAVSHHMWS